MRNLTLGGAAFLLLTLSACRSSQHSSAAAERPYREPPPDMYRLPPPPPPSVAQGPSPARPAPPPNSRDAWPPANGRISRRWSTIVIHHSATGTGGARTFDQFHRSKGWDELGYHFVIGNGSDSGDGAIEVGSRWHKQKHGAHCKTPNQYYNEHGIGICLVGDFTRTRPSPRQMESLTRLVRYLCDTCNIPPSRVTAHGEVNPKTKCPGRFFALGSFKRRLFSGAAMSSAY